jgi:outer membrane protein TolC
MDALTPCFRKPLRSRYRRAFRWWPVGLPLLGVGCAAFNPPVEPEATTAAVVRAVSDELPPPKPALPTETIPTLPAETAKAKVLPIGLDTVLRLAEEQNLQVAIARARVQEACAEREVAASHWLPDIYVGSAYYRHEGGIQDFFGELIHSSYGSLFEGMEVDARIDIREVAFGIASAERKTWQQKGELSKVTYDTLQDAAHTYIDLLAARTGEAVARELQDKLQQLVERAQKMAGIEPGSQVEVERVQTELSANRVNLARLREQASAASAKLVYLLGLDPCTTLVPIDHRLTPIELNDLSVPVCDLVARALSNGPGIHEMEGMLAQVNEGIERAKGPAKFLPIFALRMAEGGFGAGPGANLAWDNRWDLGLQARWNLTEFAALKQRREVTRARLEQLHLGHDDLQRKLAVGVETVHSSLLADGSEIQLSEEQLQHANRGYDLSKLRLENNAANASVSEVVLSLQNVARAQLSYISSIRDYDKDQVRLMLLLGAGKCAPGH